MSINEINLAEVLTILIPICTFLAWIWNRIDKKFDKVDARFEKVDARFDKVDARMDRIEAKMDQGFADLRQEIRQNRIEAILFQGGHIEIRKTGTEDKK
jgi:tetrahydromethanopterin S-methyltransferase subunit G